MRKAGYISAHIESKLLQETFRHLLRLKVDYFDQTNNTEIMNVIYTDIGNMTSIADRGIFFVFTQFFSIMGGFVGLFVISDKMAVLVLIFLPLKYCMARFWAKKQKRLIDHYIEESREFSGWFGDMVSGIQEIKLFNISGQKEKEFVEKQRRIISRKKKMNMAGQWNLSADGILLNLLTMVIYIVGADQVFSCKSSVGSLFAFITYSSCVTSPIMSIMNLGYMFAGILPSTKRFYSFMESEEEKMYDGGKEAFPGDLEFENVYFSYEEEKDVLQGISHKFIKGSKTAIVGRNGAGKTTMIKLIARIYQPRCGRILLNGTNIEEYELSAYRSLIAVVSQRVYLFNDTIRNNIVLYQQVEERVFADALTDSGLQEFVEEVGPDYRIGQDGALLSGGQRQKVALARALIQDRPIVIFDEVTSNADVESQHRMENLFLTKLRDKTVIVITHKREIEAAVDEVMRL